MNDSTVFWIIYIVGVLTGAIVVSWLNFCLEMAEFVQKRKKRGD